MAASDKQYHVFHNDNFEGMRKNPKGDYAKGPYKSEKRAQLEAEKLRTEHGGNYVVDDAQKGPLRRDFEKWMYGRGHDMSQHGEGKPYDTK